MAFQRILTCPFCSDGRGAVGVDIHTLLGTALLSDAEMPALKIDAATRGMVAFNPEETRRSPCSHLVSFDLVIDVRHRKHVGNVYAQRRNLAFGWEHAGLSRLGVEVGNFIWLSVLKPWSGSVRPATPCRIKLTTRKITIAGTPVCMQFYTHVILAADRHRFLTEMARRHKEWIAAAPVSRSLNPRA